MLDWVLNIPADFLLQNYFIVSLIEIFLPTAKNRKKKFSCYIDILGMTDKKQKQAVLLQFISEKVQEIFGTLLDT